MSSEHADLERLAERDAGLLPPEQAEAVASHLAGCAECRRRAATLQQVQHALAALPPERIPTATADRLTTALRGSQAEPGAPVASGRDLLPRLGRRSRRLSWPTLAVAAALVAVVAALAVPPLIRGNNGNSSGSAGGSNAGTAARPSAPAVSTQALQAVEHATGTAYTGTTIADQVSRRLLSGRNRGQGSAGSAMAPLPSGTAASKRSAGSTYHAATSVASPLQALAQPSRLLACLSLINGSPPTSPPLSVDLASFDGKPAAIILLREDAKHDLAYAVGPKCGTLAKLTPASTVKTPDLDLLDYQEVPLG